MSSEGCLKSKRSENHWHKGTREVLKQQKELEDNAEWLMKLSSFKSTDSIISSIMHAFTY